MTPTEFVKSRLAAELSGIPVFDVRDPNVSDDTKGVTKPAIILRLEGSQRENLMDGPDNGTATFFEIECRATSCKAATNLGDDIISALTGRRLTHILSRYDEPDDIDQQRGEYFSHIMNVGISTH